LESGTKNKFGFHRNLNSTNLPIRTADVGITIVPESQSMEFTRFGFILGIFYLEREELNASFGA
jgi:hypothetical protein